MRADIDRYYYDGENHGYWLRSPDWGLLERYQTACSKACDAGLACWLPGFDPDYDIPF